MKRTSKEDFFIKSAGKNGRATFAIIRRTRTPDGVVKHETLQHEALDSINRRYRTKQITAEQGLNLCKEVLKGLKPPPPLIHYHAANLNVLKDYWKSEYENRDITAPEKAYDRLRRAVEAVGKLSLEGTPVPELQKEIDHRFKGNKQRAIASALNQILRYLGRTEKIRKVRKEIIEISSLSEGEFHQVLSQVEDKYRLPMLVAYGSGMRIGELFAIRAQDVESDHVNVLAQIDENLIRRETKNRQIRKAWIIPQYREAVRQWASIPMDQRLPLRNFRWAGLVKEACERAKTESICYFHHLRHSYVRNLMAHGVGISQIATSLGNGVEVCQQQYAGFTLTSEAIQYISSTYSQHR